MCPGNPERFPIEFEITDQGIEKFRACGGARAQGGICGALFSAEKLLTQVEKPGITEEFKTRTGGINCLEI